MTRGNWSKEEIEKNIPVGELTLDENNVMTGLMLGDGNLDGDGVYSSSLYITHGIKQQGYNIFFIKLLKKFNVDRRSWIDQLRARRKLLLKRIERIYVEVTRLEKLIRHLEYEIEGNRKCVNGRRIKDNANG